MPAARLALYQKGIEIYIAPNADDLPSWTATMQHIAKEGRCFVINCNQFCKVTLSCPFPFLFSPSCPSNSIAPFPKARCNNTQVSDFPPTYPPFAATNPSDKKPDGSVWEANDILSHGGSCIIGPLGTFLAEPVWDKEAILYAELPMTVLTEAKMDFDPVGSYSRPDVL